MEHSLRDVESDHVLPYACINSRAHNPFLITFNVGGSD